MALILGILIVLNSVALLIWLPRYQRKLDAGKGQADPSMPSLRTLRRVAVGLLIFGILSIVASFFKFDDF